MKKVLCIGDLHCGSVGGITHPDYFWKKTRDYEIAMMQRETWSCFQDILREIGDVDVLIVNGDAIDGKGVKSGGTELITSDLNEQVEMAKKVIEEINFENIYFTYGTPYHVSSGSGEDMEKILANYFDSLIESHLKLNIEDVIFDIRHDVGSSSTPYSRNTSISKQVIWDRLNTLMRQDSLKTTVYLRSHVHYFGFCGDKNSIAFTLPALQTSTTKFGKRRCMGTTDWGVLLLCVEDGCIIKHQPYIYNIESCENKIIKVY